MTIGCRQKCTIEDSSRGARTGMNKKALILFVLLCLLLPTGGCKKEEATFKGRPAQYWLTSLDDLDPRMRQTAIISLGAIGPEAAKAAVPALIALLEEDQMNDQIVTPYALLASQSLAKIGKQAVPALVDALKNHPDGRQYAK